VKRKVYIVEPNSTVVNMFKTAGWETVREYNPDVHLACFTGGEDISPYLYGEKVLAGAGVFTNFKRDLSEVRAYKELPRSVPKVGICRGAQLMNVLCGGRMWQHVTGHGNYHEMLDNISGQIIEVSSVHHQMMIPAADAQILGVANESDSKENQYELWKRETADEEANDIEELMYDHDNAFCAQYHPEFGPKPCRDHFFDRLELLFARDWKRIDERANNKPEEVHCG